MLQYILDGEQIIISTYLFSRTAVSHQCPDNDLSWQRHVAARETTPTQEIAAGQGGLDAYGLNEVRDQGGGIGSLHDSQRSLRVKDIITK